MIVQSTSTPKPCRLLCVGDSQTLSLYNTLAPTDYYPYKLAGLGATGGYSLDVLNLGNAGWTTSNSTSSPFGINGIALERLQTILPDVVVYYAGVNDPANSITGASTQSNIQTFLDYCLSSTYSVKAKYVLVLNTNYLNYATGGDTTKSVSGITRSGTTATATCTAHGFSTSDTVNIPNASDANLCGTYTITVTGANTFTYTVANTGATSVGACNTTNVYTTYNTLRTYQAAAAAYGVSTYPNKCSYGDLWAYQQSLVIAGTWTQGNDSQTQIATSNQHMNGFAETSVAQFIYNTLTGLRVLDAWKAQ